MVDLSDVMLRLEIVIGFGKKRGHGRGRQTANPNFFIDCVS